MSPLPRLEIAAFLDGLPAHELDLLDALLRNPASRRAARALIAQRRPPKNRRAPHPQRPHPMFARVTAQTLARAEELLSAHQAAQAEADAVYREVTALPPARRAEFLLSHPLGASFPLAQRFLTDAANEATSLDEQTEALDAVSLIAGRLAAMGDHGDEVEGLLWRADVGRARILRHLGDLESALGMLRLAADGLPLCLGLPERAEYCREAAHCHAGLGAWDEALALYRQAENLALEGGEIRAAAEDACAAAGLWVEGNAPIEALAALERARAAWEGDVPARCAVAYWSARAGAHLSVGDVLRALSATRRLLAVCQREERAHVRAAGRAAAARGFADLNHPKEARAALVTALGDLPTPSPFKLSLQLDAAGFLLLEGNAPTMPLALAPWLARGAEPLGLHHQAERALKQVLESLLSPIPPARSGSLCFAAAAYLRRAAFNPLMTFRPEAWR